MTPGWLALSEEVRAALDEGRPVVALESSLIAQGLPVPHNLETALAAGEPVDVEVGGIAGRPAHGRSAPWRRGLQESSARGAQSQVRKA